MSKIFDALRKAKNEQADALFRPSASKESVARAPKLKAPEVNENKQEFKLVAPPIESAPIVESTQPITQAAPPPVAAAPQIPPTMVTADQTAPYLQPAVNVKHNKITIPKKYTIVAIGDRSLAGEQFAGLRA